MLLDSIKENIESPCIRNCCLDESDICVGCFRSLDEILEWSKASENDKKMILLKTQTRRKISQDSADAFVSIPSSFINVKTL